MRHRRESALVRAPHTSLWLYPRRSPTTVDLSRWLDYPHFIETLEQYGAHLPKSALVRWSSSSAFLRPLEDPSEWSFVSDVAARVRRGEDVPPLVLDRGEIYDGVHRAHAARALGILRAPTVDLELIPR